MKSRTASGNSWCEIPQGFLDKVKMLPMLAEMGKFFQDFPWAVKENIVKDGIDLNSFPCSNAGRRMQSIHHAAVRGDARSEDWQA
jgi:hypothetical protein